MVYEHVGKSSEKYHRELNLLLEPLKTFLGVDRIWRNFHTKSGQYSHLVNYPRASELFFEDKLYLGSPYFRNPCFYQNGFQLHQNPDPHTHATSRDGDCHHILLAVRKQGDDVVKYGFATSRFYAGFEASYLNNMPLISKFIDYFEEKAARYIDESMEHSVNIVELLGSGVYNQRPHIHSSCITPEMELIFLTAIDSDSERAKILRTLTKSERECLRYYIEGCTMPEIAKLRFRSVRTIEDHLENARSKLGIKTRKELFDFLIPYKDIF